MPKPRGYIRIDLPQKSFQLFDTNFPYTFQYSSNATINPSLAPGENPYWINIQYPKFKATIYVSYKTVNNNLQQYTEDSRGFVMKHIPKATSIDELEISNPKNKVYGVIYEIQGIQAASPYQFYLTDSTIHFVRGALYFEVVPNNDSLQPVIAYLKEDLEQMIQTFRWKKNYL